jgi:hypothetical protein
MTFQLTADQQVNATLAFADKEGNAIAAPTFDAVPTWASDTTTILTVNAAADGMSAELVTVGPTGNANVTFNGTVGGVAFTATLAVTVVAGALASVTIVPGTPASK